MGHPGESRPSLFAGTKVTIIGIIKKGKGDFLLDSGIKDDSYLYIIYKRIRRRQKTNKINAEFLSIREQNAFYMINLYNNVEIVQEITATLSVLIIK